MEKKKVVERTEADIIAEKPEVVTLAGKTYEIKPQKVRENLDWRQKCGILSGKLVAGFEGLKEGDDVKVKDVLKDVMPLVFGEGFDVATEMMFAYSEELKADEEKIRADATDEEMTNAVFVCFRFGYPFFKAMVDGMLKVLGVDLKVIMKEATKKK